MKSIITITETIHATSLLFISFTVDEKHDGRVTHENYCNAHPENMEYLHWASQKHLQYDINYLLLVFTYHSASTSWQNIRREEKVKVKYVM